MARKRKLGLLEDDEKSELADIASAEDNELANKTTAKGISGSAKSHVPREMIVTCHSLSSDLVPREAVEKWLKYLREEFPAVAFKCSTQQQRSNLGWKAAKKAAKPSNILQTSDCLGAETLLKLLKNYSRSHELKKSITVGIVGLPNVGKSSLINSLKRSHAVNVGATPGLTRTMQEIQLDKNVKLLDCPGVVMIRASDNGTSVALRNCKKIEKLDDPISPVKEILELCPAEKLMSLYKLPSFSTVDEFLQRVATVRGKLKKGGVVDVEAAARIVLHDWNEGKIPYYTFPPVRNQGETFEAAILSELGKEFSVDEVYKTESSFIGALHLPRNSSTLRCHQDDAPSKVVTRDDDEQMASVDGDALEAKGNNNRRQNDKLYTAEGILNPHARRAEKKRRKALKSAKANEMDTEYDIEKDDGMKSGDNEGSDVGKIESGGDHGREAPMSGVELDA
ncbi:hypothetical protein QJS10_CPA06g00485 [Acorus calamus]|uniref:G domain-containing protein n=1 Tax=Acorus calamus TaxID=4465 RepID=A0AAV9ENG9_ACOCL|nr:hypothetical protein QJS10_CPA06g00485 [Acorus calamus]